MFFFHSKFINVLPRILRFFCSFFSIIERMYLFTSVAFGTNFHSEFSYPSDALLFQFHDAGPVGRLFQPEHRGDAQAVSELGRSEGDPGRSAADGRQRHETAARGDRCCPGQTHRRDARRQGEAGGPPGQGRPISVRQNWVIGSMGRFPWCSQQYFLLAVGCFSSRCCSASPCLMTSRLVCVCLSPC